MGRGTRRTCRGAATLGRPESKGRFAGVLATSLIALAAASSARAALVVLPAQSFSYEESAVLRNADFDPDQFRQTLNVLFGQTPTLLFAGFDRALGDLQTVRIILDSHQQITGGVSVAVPAGASSAWATTRPSYENGLSVWGTRFGASHGNVISARELPPLCGAPREACLDRVTHAKDFDLDLRTAMLSPFQGPDVQVELDYLITMPLELLWERPNPNVTFLSEFKWSGTVQLIYDYTPAVAVPEPATWALLILGFGATGSMLRRGRHGKVAEPAVDGGQTGRPALA